MHDPEAWLKEQERVEAERKKDDDKLGMGRPIRIDVMARLTDAIECIDKQAYASAGFTIGQIVQWLFEHDIKEIKEK